MAVSRRRRRRRQASIGVGALVFALLPNMIGFQDLGSLLVRQPGVAARAQRHVIASLFGTIHDATFSLPSRSRRPKPTRREPTRRSRARRPIAALIPIRNTNLSRLRTSN